MLSFPFLYLPQAFNKTDSRIYISTETKPEEYEGVCLNTEDIPPDDLDDVILGRMVEEAIVFYKMEMDLNSLERHTVYVYCTPSTECVPFELKS